MTFWNRKRSDPHGDLKSALEANVARQNQFELDLGKMRLEFQIVSDHVDQQTAKVHRELGHVTKRKADLLKLSPPRATDVGGTIPIRIKRPPKMIETLNKPNDKRGFIHKRIGKFVGRIAAPALSIVGGLGIPGISAGARLSRSFLGGGKRSRGFLDARAVQKARARRALQIRGPQPTGPGGIAGLFPGVPGGVTGFAQAGPATDQCPKGFHINKSSYFLKDGSFVAQGTLCVRNRRRNNDNGRAAMRAARRLLGRKKSQDAIDRALRAFAPARRRKASVSPGKGTTIVQN